MRPERAIAAAVAALVGLLACGLPHVDARPPGEVAPSDIDGTARARALALIEQGKGARWQRLFENPALQARFAGLTQREQEQLLQKLMAEGMPRLSDEILAEKALLVHEALGAADEATCGSFLIGTSGSSIRLFSFLPNASLERWHEIAVLAAEASLRDDPSRYPDEVETEEARLQLCRRMPEQDRLHVLDVIQNPQGVGQAEACWAMRSLFRAFSQLTPEEQSRVARVLAL